MRGACIFELGTIALGSLYIYTEQWSIHRESATSFKTQVKAYLMVLLTWLNEMVDIAPPTLENEWQTNDRCKECECGLRTGAGWMNKSQEFIDFILQI